MDQRTVVLLAGPTASGKSALAVRLARALGGAVVNADSMQVYRDLRVLTARPGEAEEAETPHRLYGHVDGASNHSVGRFVSDVAALLAEDGRPLVLVGGTGLYFQALTDGLSAIPPVPDGVRAAVRAAAADRTTPDLHADLARRDPAGAARLRPSDRLRVLRALEIHAATGRSVLSFQGARVPGPLAGQTLAKLFLVPDRAKLRDAIDRRFEAMLAAGALDEVRALAERRLDPALPVMRAHGVPALLAHLRGDLGLPDAVARGTADTRAYAKRQMTWFRGQMAGWSAVEPERAYDAARALVDTALREGG